MENIIIFKVQDIEKKSCLPVSFWHFTAGLGLFDPCFGGAEYCQMILTPPKTREHKGKVKHATAFSNDSTWYNRS